MECETENVGENEERQKEGKMEKEKKIEGIL